MKLDAKKLLDKARGYAAKGKLGRAIELYRQVLDRDPSDAGTWLKLAETRRRAGTPDAAAEDYVAAARAYRKRGFAQKAAAAIEQALRLRPVADTHVEAGSVYRELSQHGNARRHLRAAAIEYGETKRDTDLVGVLEELADIDPRDVETRMRLAAACERIDRKDDAVAHYAQAAELYLSCGDPQRSLRALKICYEARPHDPELLEVMLRAFEAAGRPDKVAAVRAERNRLLGGDGAPPQFAVGTSRKPPASPKDMQIGKVFDEAVAYIQRGQRDRAIPLLRAIVKTTPTHEDARRVLAELTGDRG